MVRTPNRLTGASVTPASTRWPVKLSMNERRMPAAAESISELPTTSTKVPIRMMVPTIRLLARCSLQVAQGDAPDNAHAPRLEALLRSSITSPSCSLMM